MLIRTGFGGQLSGSVGGVVASHNRGGQYLRNRSIPVNTNTDLQQLVRGFLTAASQTWRTLTDAQRGGWTAYAASTPVLNRLGESITLSGHGMYVRCNAFRLSAGGSQVTSAPPVPGSVDLGGSRTIVASAASGISFTCTGATADSFTLISYGPPQSPGVQFFRAPYSLFARATMTATGFAATSPVGFRYGGLVVGELRPVRIASCNADGRLSDTFEQIVTVAA